MSSVCHRCSYGIKYVDDNGELQFTEKAKKILENKNYKWGDLPCGNICKMGGLNGSNYNQGRDIVSIDAMHGDMGDDFDRVEPIYEAEYESRYIKNHTDEDEKYDVLLLPIDTILHINTILRTLDNDIRALVEYKLTYPEEQISDCARILKIEPQKAYVYLNRAKKQHPMLKYLLDKDKHGITKMLSEQKNIDNQRYDDIEDRLSKFNDADFIHKIRPLAHFFNLSLTELKEYYKQR